MKINKVNIHAFRLFGDESVDFSAKKDSRKTANFVALYAPNGFGKTSFFDSMEFCMTGKFIVLMIIFQTMPVRTNLILAINLLYITRIYQKSI